MTLGLPRLLTAGELSEYLRVPIRTLEGWRQRGGGPPFSRLGNHVRYSEEDVLEWLASRDSRRQSEDDF